MPRFTLQMTLTQPLEMANKTAVNLYVNDLYRAAVKFAGPKLKLLHLEVKELEGETEVPTTSSPTPRGVPF